MTKDVASKTMNTLVLSDIHCLHTYTQTKRTSTHLLCVHTYSPQSEMMTFCFGFPSFVP